MLKINDNNVMMKEYKSFIKDNNNKTTHSRKNPLESSVATLALGEATGHHHSIDVMHDENKDVEVIRHFNKWGYNERSSQGLGRVPDYFQVSGSEATIKHQEHDSITLPEGIYRVRIVKEYDPFSNTTRGVAD